MRTAQMTHLIIENPIVPYVFQFTLVYHCMLIHEYNCILRDSNVTTYNSIEFKLSDVRCDLQVEYILPH